MTSNELILLKSCSKHMESPVLEVGSRIINERKTGNPRQFFKEHKYFGIDLEDGEGVDMVHDMEMPLRRKFRSVVCCSVLEHCEHPWVLARNIESCLESGGTLFVSAPFVWRYHGYPSDYWRFSAEAFRILFPRIEWDFIRYATKDRKQIYKDYFQLSLASKYVRKDGEAAIAMVIGFGKKI